MSNWNSDKIKSIRKKMGLSQTEFAHLLGCRQQTVSEWELGLYEPANAYSRLLESMENSGVSSVVQKNFLLSPEQTEAIYKFKASENKPTESMRAAERKPEVDMVMLREPRLEPNTEADTDTDTDTDPEIELQYENHYEEVREFDPAVD